jgi:hypothetical protein
MLPADMLFPDKIWLPDKMLSSASCFQLITLFYLKPCYTTYNMLSADGMTFTDSMLFDKMLFFTFWVLTIYDKHRIYFKLFDIKTWLVYFKHSSHNRRSLMRNDNKFYNFLHSHSCIEPGVICATIKNFMYSQQRWKA